MKKITCLLTVLALASCQKEDSSGIPTYLKINNITLDEGSTNSNITDAWVYVNDQLQGVYELPAKFPVLEEEIQTVRIKAGIKVNGIASSRIAYPFYSSYYADITFTPNETKTIIPIISYLDSIDFFLEDFEGTGLNIEISAISDTTLLKLVDENNNYGAGILSDSLFTFEISTDELTDLPQAGAPVFLELDYKSNTQFLVGVYVNYPQSVIQKDLLWINPKQEWNKIYVNLTSTISEGINASSFKVFIGMKRDFELEKNELFFDNLKVVY
ncbi:MAG: hypothetical protein HN522_02260 [Flavobacteriales bacterium]|jgi:hypothetical protein|nr:hypothetical protein [Flavobacteriales bacterium]MBT5089881.1 hypothetical protein [Flavobacteriales bacterium]MBT5749708.1 hypothetical protein [Flavobacteriales bacterium]